MWNRGEPQQPPERASPQAQPAVRAQVPPTASGMLNVIGASIRVVGDIYSEEDLVIEGEVEGSLEIKNCRLTVGPRARAKSNIKAREVVIQGQVQGDVDATQKITIRREGSLVGNIRTTGIVIDDDAYFKGNIDIIRKPKEPQS